MEERRNIVVIGDSTIDNRAWVSPGLFWNAMPFFRPKREDTQTRIAKSKLPQPEAELTVVENLIDSLPAYEFKDFTNDGFTTRDVLIGAFRDKVFSNGGFFDNIFYLEMFPHTKLSPLADSRADIKNASYVILSVGGNNLREFLVQVNRERSPEAKQQMIAKEFQKTLADLKQQYLQIVDEILETNKTVKLILMTQYYPSFMQSTYKIYEFIALLGDTLNLKNATPADIINELMTITYKAILSELVEKYPANIIVADITSTLNPFEAANHVYQIEPSGKGGKIIANLLRHIIASGDNAVGFSHHLSSKAENSYQATKIAEWQPMHPNEFKDQKHDNANNAASPGQF